MIGTEALALPGWFVWMCVASLVCAYIVTIGQNAGGDR